MKLILWHFRNLLTFTGRESRPTFWPFAAIVFALAMIGTMAVMLPSMLDTFTRVQQFAIDHPDQVTVTQGPGHYSMTVEGYHPDLMPDFGALIGGMALVSLLVIALMAAAVSRRLHDRGIRGYWGLLPLPFLFSGFYLMHGMFSMADPDMRLFALLFVNNVTYLACLGILAFLLVGASDLQPNRFGSPWPVTS